MRLGLDWLEPWSPVTVLDWTWDSNDLDRDSEFKYSKRGIPADKYHTED